ncbi:MAG TPA: hypothetical protein VNI52_14580, partial [Sphingobacteriaceae bacterium]|nr:hypothetical protein [Sphingobacteriaceae bacterium]
HIIQPSNRPITDTRNLYPKSQHNERKSSQIINLTNRTFGLDIGECYRTAYIVIWYPIKKSFFASQN